LKVFKPGASPEPTIKAWIDAILFWGGFAVICGVLGTLIGIILASQSIEAAGEVSPVLVWGGIKVAFLTSVFGILILAFAALSWFGLQLRWRLLTADRTNPTG
jgi:flagellar motor component MotA